MIYQPSKWLLLSVEARCARQLAPHQRQVILRNGVDQAKQGRFECAYYITWPHIEAGHPPPRMRTPKPIDVFKPFNSPRKKGRTAFTENTATFLLRPVQRVPLGAVSLISSFTFPLYFAAHKVASAVAVGYPSVLKLASKTPSGGALLLGEIWTVDDNTPSDLFHFAPQLRDGRPTHNGRSLQAHEFYR